MKKRAAQALSLVTVIILLASVAAAQERPEDRFRIEPGRTAEEYYNIGNWYSKREQHYRAVAYYRAAVREKEDFVEAWINMGTAYRAAGRYDDAVSAYRQAIDIGSKEHFVFLNLGNSYVDAGRLREAVLAFRTFVSLEPYDPDGHVNLGVTLFRLKDYSAAAETFEKLLIIDKDSGYFHFQAARCYALLRRMDEARKHLREALRLEPNIRYALLQDTDFRSFRRSPQYRELLSEFDSLRP